MAQLKNFYEKYKRELKCLGALLITIILIEGFIFNREYLLSKFIKLEERHYSVNEGTLFQFNFVSGKLVSQGNDPNITFDNVKLPVGFISIYCDNSVRGAVGQVFYRNDNESFSEAHSIVYDASLADETLLLNQVFGFPKIVTVSSLRFDLTNVPGDIVSCNDFVINPSVPFALHPARLAIYIGTLLFSILFFFRRIKSIVYIRGFVWRKKVIFVLFFIILSLVPSAKLIQPAITQGIVFIVVLCILLFSITATYALVYLLEGSKPLESKNEERVKRPQHKYEIALVTILVVITLPLLTESFLYYDDWWGIGTDAKLNGRSLIVFGRPLQTLIFLVFNNVDIRNAYILKWVFLPFLLLYGIVIYRWLYSKTQDDIFSFFLAAILSAFAPAMDVLGYTSTSPFLCSIAFSALSVICFDRAYAFYRQRYGLHALTNSIFAFLFLFVALLFYQIGPQIVFVFLSIEIYFSSQKISHLKKYLKFLFLFAMAYGFYMVFIKLLNWMYHVEITTNRSQMINSFSQIVDKWHFYKLVLEQSIKQVIAAFTGNSIIFERYRGYIVSFSDQSIGNVAFYFVVMMILVAFISYYFRTRNIIGLFSLFIFIPMSDFVFLLLSESGYLTYYAFAHISLVMFYFLMGLIASIQFVWGKINIVYEEVTVTRDIKPSKIVAPLLIVCALVSNYYIRDFYINYNIAVYNFVKYSLQTAIKSGGIKRIYVIGTISPLNADEYSRFVTETALKDLGENVTDYAITYSSNRYFMARMQEDVYLKVYEQIPEADKQLLEKIYAFDEKYKQYNIIAWPSEENRKDLLRIFTWSGVIPQTTSPDTLIIDISWTEMAYYIHAK